MVGMLSLLESQLGIDHALPQHGDFHLLLVDLTRAILSKLANRTLSLLGEASDQHRTHTRNLNLLLLEKRGLTGEVLRPQPSLGMTIRRDSG